MLEPPRKRSPYVLPALFLLLLPVVSGFENNTLGHSTAHSQQDAEWMSLVSQLTKLSTNGGELNWTGEASSNGGGAISPRLQIINQVESLAGQAAKLVVYGGATFARYNSRVLCPLLSHETNQPEDDEDQPILFVFNNHLNKERAYRIYADDEITEQMVLEAGLNRHQMTYIFVHGWLGGIHNELWLSEAKNTVLENFNRLRGRGQRQGLNSSDTSHQVTSGAGGAKLAQPSEGDDDFKPNVIIVEWSDFAMGSLYEATQNSFKVSRRLGRLLSQLTSTGADGGLQPELMHCLGHSIGTHICGQAARLAFPAGGRRRMGRITGLDPGGFCYELGIRNETTYRGLRPSDALLVDAYVSNRSPFGNKYQVAQYNVRLNNGFFQQDCSVWRNPEQARKYFQAAVRFLLGSVGHNDIITCDHYFATRFSHQLVSRTSLCTYVGYACHSYDSFLRGRCGLCRTPNGCYSMDFEYQRPEASVEHALQHIRDHSSYFHRENFTTFDQNTNQEILQPLGGVPYAQRRAYYMLTTNESPYCSITFRIRVHLNRDTVNLRSFRTDWLRLQFVDSDEQILKVKESSSAKIVQAVSLNGPWTTSSEDLRQGVSDTTLTALIELVDLGGHYYDNVQPDEPLIREIIVEYDNHLSRTQDPLANPIELIQLDYLSTSDQRVKSVNSRQFQRDQFTLIFRHLERHQQTLDLSPPVDAAATGSTSGEDDGTGASKGYL